MEKCCFSFDFDGFFFRWVLMTNATNVTPEDNGGRCKNDLSCSITFAKTFQSTARYSSQKTYPSVYLFTFHMATRGGHTMLHL